jgi:hypothetical protein
MTDFIFQPYIVMGVDDDRQAIALKFVESITLDIDDTESLVVERLKGDRHLIFKMTSGKEYRISMLAQVRCFTKYTLPSDPKEMQQCIFDKWYHIISTT